jgi:cephalosporin hydroxylase
MDNEPDAVPSAGPKRRLAARWDRIAAERARVIIARGKRPGADRGTRELAEALTDAVLATPLPAPGASGSRRGFLEAAVQERLADIASGSGPTPAEIEAISRAFTALWHPTGEWPQPPADIVKQTIADQFHRLYYHLRPRVWEQTTYRGWRILKLTSDLWIYANLIHDIKPGVIIETGTRYGGSALWLADQLDMLGSGQVITIDIDDDYDSRPEHPRITYVTGSSGDPDVAQQVAAMLPNDGSPVMLILDADHSRDHVLAELRVFASLVTSGSYLIVEDTNINGHPVFEEFGPGPYEAVEAFLAENDDFEVDESRHLYYVTQNPRGYLRRT